MYHFSFFFGIVGEQNCKIMMIVWYIFGKLVYKHQAQHNAVSLWKIAVLAYTYLRTERLLQSTATIIEQIPSATIIDRHMVLMMTSSNKNIFRVSGHLCGEFTGHQWSPRTKASDAELWWFLWSAHEKTMVRLVIWDAIVLIMTSL